MKKTSFTYPASLSFNDNGNGSIEIADDGAVTIKGLYQNRYDDVDLALRLLKAGANAKRPIQRPTGRTIEKMVTIVPEKGYYKSFGHPHAADNWVVTQECKKELRRVEETERVFVPCENNAYFKAALKALNSLISE